MSNLVNLEALQEDKVRAILRKDEEVARANGKSSFWKAFNESLEHVGNADFKNTVFLHTVKSMQFATKQQTALTEATTTASVSTYNKAMLPTIIRRVFPSVVVTKFIATRQLDVPTQLIQTFRLSRNTDKNGISAGTEFFDPAQNKQYPTGGTATWQGNRGALDQYYSSEVVSGEKPTFSALATPLTLAYGPVATGSVAIYIVKDNDPRNRVLRGVDNGALGINDTAGSPISGASYSVGVMGGTAPSVTLGASFTALAGGEHYEVDYSYVLERNKLLSELTFVQNNINVAAKARKNYAQITAEAIQDLEAYSDGKIDALKELISGMTEIMALEIDQELILAMLANAGKLATFDNTYPTGEFRGTQAQRNQELVHKMNFLANDMSVDFLRGDDFFAVCHPHVFSILQNTNDFRMLSQEHNHQGDFSTGAEKIGQVEGFKIAKAPQMPYSDKVLLGYYSKDLQKSPYAYFPYVTYLTPPMMDVRSGDIFSTVVGLQQRYDHKLMLDGKYGLGTLTVQNLY